MLISTYLVSYLGAIKSFLDAIAICLDTLYYLQLAPVDRDLCRRRIHESLLKANANVAARYQSHTAFYKTVKDWRNAAQHQVAPAVAVCGFGTHSAPGNIPRDEVNILLVNKPGLLPSDLLKPPADLPWVKPNEFFPAWRNSIDLLLAAVCDDIMRHCPD